MKRLAYAAGFGAQSKTIESNIPCRARKSRCRVFARMDFSEYDRIDEDALN